MSKYFNLKNISKFEMDYMEALMRTMVYGEEEFNERTGLKTKRIPGVVFKVDLSKEFPFLKTKKVLWKSAIEEILWIMQKASNNIHDLKPHIWDEWADENGSIGRAYGYQIWKFDQVRKVLDTLKKDPSSRRAVIDLWNFADLNEMNLVPCCYTSVWSIINGKLNCMLSQRSGDAPLGVVFNTLQYSALLLMFAKHLGVEPGVLTHCIADFHIYENQYEGVNKQIKNYRVLLLEPTQMYESEPNLLDELGFTKEEIQDIYYNETKFSFETDKTDFFDFTVDDFKLENYKNMGKIEYPIAV